jgi:hypothetical protein
MQELSAVFGQVQELLSAGISIVPVRDKAETKQDGTIIPAKVAYSGWKQYQSTIISKEALWYEMDKHNTTAIAMVCGSVSGNLEIIDIDCKHWNGIDGRLFSDIRQIYPELWYRLRIHKTPSGGYHILYRIADGKAQGNKKLAWKADVKECGIETRGEGGYALAPPSMGYSIHQGANIPLITQSERDSLINLCISYNQRIKAEVSYKPTKKQTDYYDENPFDHFNGSIAAEDILTANGYKIFNDHDMYRRWTRPNRNEGGVSVTFRKDYRLYYFFTTSTEFEAGKWLTPAAVLCTLQFGGDYKKLYRHLVDSGYGKIKHEHEQRIIKTATAYNTPTPANISDEAKQFVQDILIKATETHPHGIFWAINDKGGTYISREKLYTVSHGLGYRLHKEDVTKIQGYKICRTDARTYFDELKAYIHIEDADEYETVFNALDEFIQKSGKHIIASLPILDTSVILTPTKHLSYKFYNNCYATIDKDGVEVLPYSALPTNKLIWENKIQLRDLTVTTDNSHKQSLYYKYLDLSVSVTPHVLQCIGYLCHEFKDESDAYIVVLVEQCPDPKSGGGSGKNIFSNMLKYATSVKNLPGSQVVLDKDFLQSWDYEKVLSISDVPKKFDFLFLKELSSGNGINKKLFKNISTVDVGDMPKLLVSTNYSYEVSDGGLRRRIIPIEFTDFFTKAGGVNTHFGKMFPTDWTTEDWQAYDNIILASIQQWLKVMRLTAPQLTEGGWQKQFEQEYGLLTLQFIEENITEWKLIKKVQVKAFNNTYDTFYSDNGGNKLYKLSSIRLNSALESYCQKHEIHFEKQVVMKENGILDRYKLFNGEQKNDNSAPDLVPF